MGKTSVRIKRPLWVVGLNIALALSVGTTQAFAVEDITSVGQLLGVTAGTSYVLRNDLDLATADVDSATDGIQLADDVTFGNSSYISSTFSGTVDIETVLTPATFDGGGFTIFGLTKPLFNSIGGMGADTTVFDLNLEAAPVDLEAATGGVIGNGILANGVSASGSAATVIDDVHVSGDVDGEGAYFVGGLVGDNDGGEISNSSASGNVGSEGVYYVGGLVGYNGGTIYNSYATAYVNGTDYVGGLVGDSSGTITNSYATGSVGGVGDYVGGLVGDSSGTITNSYATGYVDGGSDYVGGLVGDSSGTITNSYATGNVDGGSYYVGGLVGVSNGNITNSYATGSVGGEGAYFVGGLVGSNNGNISNSYAAGGSVIGFLEVGGLTGANYLEGNIERSYSHNAVTGLGDDNNDIGGLVGYNSGQILGSYAISNVTGENKVGGLVGENFGFVTNSYTAGYVTGVTNVGGLIGHNGGNIANSYAEATVYGDYIFGGLIGNHGSGLVTYSFSVNNDGFGEFNRTAYSDQCADEGFGEVGVICGDNISPFPSMLQVINTGLADTFAYDNCINSGIPYLVPLINSYSNGCEDLTPQINSYSLSTQALDALNKSVGFKLIKSELSKFDLAFIDQVKGDKSAQIIGSKLFANQSLSTSLSVGSLLQLEINFEANKSLQMWVKSSDDQYVLLGDITFDKDGNAVLPGIEFKKSGQYEFIFVNSDKKDLTQPELMNKVSGLTVYVN
jgi:hypothetical protein